MEHPAAACAPSQSSAQSGQSQCQCPSQTQTTARPSAWSRTETAGAPGSVQAAHSAVGVLGDAGHSQAQAVDQPVNFRDVMSEQLAHELERVETSPK